MEKNNTASSIVKAMNIRYNDMLEETGLLMINMYFVLDIQIIRKEGIDTSKISLMVLRSISTIRTQTRNLKIPFRI